ncbi:TRM11 family methyltransferase [Microlunatus sp. Gsoil 973]|uniref:TRM11 family SAM-dependent methyltransferase n=1 Tax=Microlunatus sp. Gsoil 973 TaxID=2672569 RepID=UPI0012B4E0D9|nr:site-specific DNA-methyltransferase [Microlunatus sp. Gsoil 973]QGN33867.1 site-specific DNA-methyltransferase [Microlunatus sp. Gsoil 973]
MPQYLILITPAANRVFAGQAAGLTATELEICAGTDRAAVSGVQSLAGVDYVGFETSDFAAIARSVAGLSSAYALFEQVGELLRPVELVNSDRFSDDLVTIPKYQGKTNEQFTRMLVNVTAASMSRSPTGPITLLDPLAGRGTTLSVGLTLGYDVAGVESEVKAVEAYAAFLKTYLRRKRLKHKAGIDPVRREGRSLGRRLQVEVTPEAGGRPQQLTVFTGDTRQSAALFGKRRFDLVVADAPYGVVHGSSAPGRRDRSPAALLADALPVWAGQLKPGGALGISWNTYGLTREELAAIATTAGLEPLDDGPYLRLGHRVDSAIYRDVFIARRS